MYNRMISLYLFNVFLAFCHFHKAVGFSIYNTFRTRKVVTKPWYLEAVTGADIEQDVAETTPQVVGSNVVFRGKVNEIDFCIAPADVSLSRAYSQSSTDKRNPRPKTLSLTRALNNASNRAVRRILLARCWPSAEALNLSLRIVAAAEKRAREEGIALEGTSGAKCPVPRPILNMLTGQKGTAAEGVKDPPKPRSRTDQEYVKDQIDSFREKYGALPGFDYAEAFLDSILSLATTGDESVRVKEVMESGVYDESYRRIISVLQSVGAKFEENPETERLRIAKKLVDQDFCLSMIDKIKIKQEAKAKTNIESQESTTEDPSEAEPPVQNESNSTVLEDENNVELSDEREQTSGGKRRRFMFWAKRKVNDTVVEVASEQEIEDENEEQGDVELDQDDLGSVLLSAEEPSMTRQLNALSNIVQRALLFGGDQELLVLSQTLAANKPAFVERWYPDSGGLTQKLDDESRPGVQYLNALILLLQECYEVGLVDNLDPLVPLIPSYAMAYERVMASAVELGSGYVRPGSSKIMSMPKPRTAQEELGRFAVWETAFRAGSSSSTASKYPEDLEGSWEVKDEIAGETIGKSTVVFEKEGKVLVAPPVQGLRWRLDPGPTHLDTCTFQVLGEDGTVLQYRGFIDRGARLESRFSKRALKIRGSVMFQMRDGDISLGDDYWKDMLPINYKTGTTNFVMTKILEE